MNRAAVARGFGYRADCIAVEEDWRRMRALCAQIVDTSWVDP